MLAFFDSGLLLNSRNEVFEHANISQLLNSYGNLHITWGNM